MDAMNLPEHFELTPEEDLRRRIDGLKRSMAEAGIDFAVILQNVDMFYLAGSIQQGALVIPVEEEPLFFVQKSTERALLETPLTVVPIASDREIKDILLGKGLLKGTGGMELDVIPVATFERFKRIIGFERFVDVSPLIKELRVIKSSFEIEQIIKSGAIMSHVFERARYVVKEGVREIDIDAELAAEGRKFGHHGFLRMRGLNQEMQTITVATGSTGAAPSYADVPIAGIGMTPAIPQGSSKNRVERGVPVTIDYGGGHNGYITDETRAFVVGELKELFRKPYELAREIIEDAATFGKEGVNATELFDRAQRVVKKARLEEHFLGYGPGRVSFIGHGLGLEINELPVITPRHSRVLKEGMVFAFEPKFVFPGEGVIGIEVDFIVRKDRLERVTDTSIDLVRV